MSELKPSGFGRYKIVAELGQGGMGIVYRAFDPVHEREVALKILPSTDPILLSRFKREFRALADVDHPNVVKLFELTSDGETWFFTMEILDGIDLLNYVKFGIFQSPAEIRDGDARECDAALHITGEFNLSELSNERLQRLRHGLAQLVGAIAALHANGIVHRDIKPSNVIVTPDARIVLLDFGLIAETDASGSHKSLHQQILGTVAYMSPEQAVCDPVSPASDWYSVGVMLYQALTGELPFSGNALDVLANKRSQDPVSPREIKSSVPQDLNDLCMELLCRRPAGRPGAADILQRLGEQNYECAPTKESPPNEFALVGRDSQLRALRDAYQAMLGGQTQVVFVQGRSGDGKSALAEAFVEQ
ncbi:MAG: serine/threonine-protein kinase, partial [Pirellulaceae bacterium]